MDYKKNIFKKYLKNLKNINEQYNAPRQILPKTFRQTGTIEFFRINYLSTLKSISEKYNAFLNIPK